MADYILCNRAECFANRKNRCHALHDTDFRGKPCPFFKTKEQAEEGRCKVRARLIAIGRQDLLEK